MKVELLNVGPFKDTSLELGDITVFAGENDTGKSYLNKLLFVIFKISQVNFNHDIYHDLEKFNYENLQQLNKYFSEFKEYHEQIKEEPFYQEIKNFFDNINFEITNIDEQDQIFFDNIKIQEISKQSKVLEKLLRDFSHHWEKISQSLNKIQENFNKLNLKPFKNQVDKSKGKISEWNFRFSRINDNFIDESKNLLNLINENYNIKEFILNEIFEQNFGESNKNKKYWDQETKVIIKQSEEKIFEFSINKDSTSSKFEYNEKIFNEVTYIEDFYNNLNVMPDSFKHRHSFPFFLLHRGPVLRIKKYRYKMDLETKIVNSHNLENEKSLTFIANKNKAFALVNEVFKINNITYEKGKFKRDNISFKINNSSKGLQTAVALKKIIETNIFFLENSLVIIDEPESYLHPQWQYHLIETLLELAKSHHYKLIISTHSPYFIEILYSFSQNKFPDLNFKFNYFSRNEKDDVEIITEAIPVKILDTLNYPFDKLDDLELGQDNAK